MSAVKIVSVNESARRRLLVNDAADLLEIADAFDPASRTLLRGLLCEPLEYIDHELFARPTAETLIFGRVARLAEGANKFTDLGDDPCGAYLLFEGETPTFAQETLLFQRLNYARMRLMHLISRYVQAGLDEESIRELLAWAHRVKQLREVLARVSLPLVPAMAKQARFQNLDPSDLQSEGNCALLRAIMTFDCSRGYRFSTYACRAILKSFARVILRTTRYRNHFPVEFDPAQERGNAVEETRNDQQGDCVHELRVMLAKNRAKLTDVEQTVIRERFALHAPQGEAPKTLDEIGEMIGVTKERVRQIQNKALLKLRQDMEKNYLAA